MWPRVVELLAGLWLIASPWVIGAGGAVEGRWVPWIAGAVVLVLSGSSFSPRFRMNHLGTLAVAFVVIGWGWFQTPRPGPVWAQNLMLTGLVLALMAVVPTEASRPPEGWKPYAERPD